MTVGKRQAALAIVATLCIGGLFADRLVVTPLVDGWRARRQKIGKLELELVRARALLDREALLRQRRDAMARGMLPSDISAAESLVLNEITRWAKESGIRLTSLRPGSRENADGPDQLELRASATGTMSALVRFLFELETAPLALSVETLDMSPRKQADTALVLTLRVTGLLTPARKTGEQT